MKHSAHETPAIPVGDGPPNRSIAFAQDFAPVKGAGFHIGRCVSWVEPTFYMLGHRCIGGKQRRAY
jgi:hypothetical protein